MLVIIDMQKIYPAAEQVLPAVLKELRKAKRNHELICVVRYYSTSLTMRRITRELKDVKHLTITKHDDDGGSDIIKTLSECRFKGRAVTTKRPAIEINKIKEIKVCGVNTDACVRGTVETLSLLRWPIKVLSHACAHLQGDFSEEQNKTWHRGALQDMAKIRNVEVM